MWPFGCVVVVCTFVPHEQRTRPLNSHSRARCLRSDPLISSRGGGTKEASSDDALGSALQLRRVWHAGRRVLRYGPGRASFCEVHGEEIKAGALQKLNFDAT